MQMSAFHSIHRKEEGEGEAEGEGRDSVADLDGLKEGKRLD